MLGVNRKLPFQFSLDLSASYEFRPYDHASVFSGKSADRKEHSWRFDAVLERPITGWMTASLHYGFADNDSNVAVFDYRRNVVGFLVTVRFPE